MFKTYLKLAGSILGAHLTAVVILFLMYSYILGFLWRAFLFKLLLRQFL